MKKLLGVFAIICCASLVGQAETKCPGNYKNHLQGIAVDDDGNFYWSFTTVLLKTDAAGKQLASVDVPSHYGDLTWHKDKVYVAVNLGKFNQEPGQADSWVYVHNAADLKLLDKHPVPEAVHGAGGMEWHNGRFFIVGGLPKTHQQNYVFEYNEQFEFIKRHEIPSGQTLLGIQTVCRGADGEWWFGCYGRPTVVLRTDDNFKLRGIYQFNAAVGIARTPEKSTFYIGYNKAIEKRHHGRIAKQPVSAITAKELPIPTKE